MSLLGRLRSAVGLGGSAQPSDASEVVKARLFATATYSALEKRLPSMALMPVAEWDFFAACATLAIRIETQLRDKEPVIQGIQARLNQWNPNGVAAVMDCLEYLRKCLKEQGSGDVHGRSIVEGALGIWVVRNSLGGGPLPDPVLAQAVGIAIATAADS